MNRKSLIKAAFVCVALILVLVILYSGLRILESTVFYQEQDEEEAGTKWITRDGVSYYPRKDLVVVMLLGIDRQGKLEENESNSGHMADVIMLLVFDEETETCSLLSLNRDTMAKMSGLNAYGAEDGTYYTQLARSHSFGTGLEDSCENTRKTVSNLLYGITIDYYVSMNMDGIAVLNDAVGGVTVNVVDDFSAIDPSIGMGEVTLHGQQATTYIRSRRNLGDQLNLSRMERHKAYMRGFLDALTGKLEGSDSFALSLYEQIAPYIVTDMSSNVLSSMMSRYADYELVETVSPEGENHLGENHYEFYLDQDKLEELILRLFYAPKQ